MHTCLFGECWLHVGINVTTIVVLPTGYCKNEDSHTLQPRAGDPTQMVLLWYPGLAPVVLE
jgi:hypothetical protein